MPASVSETFAAKPPVQRNYSKLWAFDTMPIEESRKLIAVYWGYVTLIDEQIGRILDAMRELGLEDRTAVCFTADHGEFTGAHRLHDKGPAMYEDIYRIPGLLRIPGAPQGQVREEFASLTDFTATVLDLAGSKTEPAVDSRSLVPLARGERPEWDEHHLAEFHGHHFPYPQRMLRTRVHKLVVNPESQNELYDLVADPDELHNRYDHPELRSVRTELTRRLYDLLRERGDNFYHWMTPMYDVETDYDTTLSAFETEQPAEPARAGQR
jgi:arylsulfatase A-like enzyme